MRRLAWGVALLVLIALFQLTTAANTNSAEQSAHTQESKSKWFSRTRSIGSPHIEAAHKAAAANAFANAAGITDRIYNNAAQQNAANALASLANPVVPYAVNDPSDVITAAGAAAAAAEAASIAALTNAAYRHHPYPVPYPVPVQNNVPYPVPVHVERKVHVPVHVPVPVPFQVDKPYAVPVPVPVGVGCGSGACCGGHPCGGNGYVVKTRHIVVEKPGRVHTPIGPPIPYDRDVHIPVPLIDDGQILTKLPHAPLDPGIKGACNTTAIDLDRKQINRVIDQIANRRQTLEAQEKWIQSARNSVRTVNQEVALTRQTIKHIKEDINDLFKAKSHLLKKLRADELARDLENAHRTLNRLHENKALLKEHSEEVQHKAQKELLRITRLQQKLKGYKPTEALEAEEIREQLSKWPTKVAEPVHH